jgi:hypothetical protein
MVLDKVINIKISAPTINYYKNNGFNDIKINDIIEIPIELLPKKSNIKVTIKCDFCDSTKLESYNAYNRYINNSKDNNYRCIKCFNKQKLESLGVSSISQIQEIKDKIKETNLKKYGGHPNKLEEFKKKIFSTNQEKYGCKMPMQNFSSKQKQKETNVKKYGSVCSLNNEDIKIKSLLSMKEKYGVQFSMQSDIIKEKIINNSKKTKIDNILNKNKEILNIDYISNLYNCFCDKCNNTYDITPHIFCLRKKYKTTICTSCNPIKDGTSGLEVELLEFIKDNYNHEIITNSKNIINPLELDIYLPDTNLAFEFNGLYWHSEEYKDKKYHLNKTLKCNELGINLIHIWEDDWIYKKDNCIFDITKS